MPKESTVQHINPTHDNTIYPDKPFDQKKITPIGVNQTAFVNHLINDTVVIGCGSAGTGKAQPLESLVRIKNGWKKMGDIEIGDLVITPKGYETKVLGVYPQGKKDIVRITFEDGRFVDCCDEHLWNVNHYKWNEEKTLSASEIKALHDSTYGKKWHRKFRIPLVKHEIKDDCEFVIPPYVMGAILGDGCLRRGVSPNICSTDQEILDRITAEFDGFIELRNTNNSTSYRLIRAVRGRGLGHNNKVTDEFRRLEIDNCLSYEKYIPKDYMELSSKKQKLDLIQGLMDTDGEVDKNGSIWFHTTSPQLKDDFVYLIRSIGGMAYTKERHTKFNGKEGRLSYRIRVRYYMPKDLVSLTRKKDRISENNQYQNCMLGIESIEYLSSPQECQCIYVEDESHLYVTNDFTVTHNTFLASRVAGMLYKTRREFKNIVLTRPNLEAGEKLGALPGDLMEKYEPYIQPFRKGLIEEIGLVKFEKDLENRKISPEPIGYMRGRTYDDSLILVDEAQNLTVETMKLILTRIGTNSKLYITGDTAQSDLKKGRGQEDGLSWLLRQIRMQGMNVPIVEFGAEDCVRSEICRMFINMIENEV